MELRRPRLEDKTAILEMIGEFALSNTPAHGMRTVWRSGLEYETCLEILLQQEEAANLSADRVPSIQFLSFDETGHPLGFLSLRLLLNEKTFIEGGHIGYSIRPSERGKGLGKEQLHLGLLEARKRGLDYVLITCDETNEASRRTILANGGKYDNTIAGSERYWLDVEAV